MRVQGQRMSIRGRLIVIYAMMLLVFFAVSLGFFLRVRNHYMASLEGQTSDLLFMVSRYLTTAMEELETESFHLVTDTSVQNDLRHYLDARTSGEKVNLRSELNERILQYAGTSQYIASITLVSDGQVSVRGRSSLREPGEAMEALLRAADEGGGGAVWRASEADPSTVLLMRSIREIRNMSLKTLGYVIYRVRLDRVARDILSDHAYLEHDMPLVISSPADGTVLYPVTAGNSGLSGMAARVPEGAFVKIGQGKDAWLVLSEGLPSGWRCALLVPYGELTAGIRRMFTWIVLGMLALTALMMVLATAFAVSFTGHFSVLLHKMERVEANNLEPMATDTDYAARRDEIGYLHQAFDRMVRKLRELIEENYTNQLLLRDEQIHSLVHQLNPHFLYNTLDLVYWEARTAGQENICAIIDSLARLLRVSLQKHEDTDTLREELELAACYMEIQQQRFGERLICRRRIDETLLEARLPFMSLQPLLENAMRYGVENSTEPCCVEIRACREGDSLFVSVVNEGSEFTEEALERLKRGADEPRGHGIALDNIDRRTRLLFGQDYGIRVVEKKAGSNLAEVGVLVPLMLPEKEAGK